MTTLEHLFWVKGKGWLTARDLLVGDSIQSLAGRLLEVKSTASLTEPGVVYNIGVRELNTYFVGKRGALVHNSCNKAIREILEKYAGKKSPFFIRLNDDLSPMAIDTGAFSTGPRTANGGIRNSQEFWARWKDAYPETLSERNLWKIENELSPEVDDVWLETFDEHADFMRETIEHHHINHGKNAYPLPESLHRGKGANQIWHYIFGGSKKK